MKKKLFSSIMLLTIVVIIVLFTGCGGNKGDNNTLIYGSQDYTTINPALYEHGEINSLIFAGLTSHDENNKVVPGLAKSWTWDENSKTYVFKLKEGLTFHDGEPVTSNDVKFTLEAILNEKNQSEIISNYNDIESISCPDDETVIIKLKENNVAFPDYMTIGILPKHLLEGEDLITSEFNQKPVGAGPYMVTEWDQGQSITMKKFNNYYGGEPNIETVVFKIVPDSDARAIQIETGDIHMAQVTPKGAKQLEGNEEINIYNMKTADYRAIAYNFNSKLFKENSELPNILSYGINRDAIIKSVQLGEGEKAYSPIQKNKYNNEDINKFQYNPKKCQALLAENGWKKAKDGFYEKNGQQLSFTISAMADDKVRVDMATMCANQLQQIGIKATAEAKAELDWDNQDSCIIGWGSPFDADDHTYKVFSTGAGDNYTAYSNEKIDSMLSLARHTNDEEARRHLYKKFQEEMTKDMPYTFISYVDADYAVGKNITGISENTVLGHHGVGIFWNISKWKINE
ncbi:MAG: ABC transporter substrate-binding protein [Eubacteriales bacterium]|nr:ABC transporter substrate-binding protein [Eubacteriales bacterium]